MKILKNTGKKGKPRFWDFPMHFFLAKDVLVIINVNGAERAQERVLERLRTTAL